jgi:LysM repeat protein
MPIDSVRPQEAPRPVPPPAQPPPERHIEHEVQHGETMTEISNRYQATMPQLHDANPQISNPDRLNVGQRVRVPIGDGYGREPIAVQAQPGDTLKALAGQYHQPVTRIAAANGHSIANPEHIQVGQQIWIPGGYTLPPSAKVQPGTPGTAPAAVPPDPLAQTAQATDAAAQRAGRAQKTYDEVSASTNGSGSALPYLSQQLTEAKGGLQTAVDAEITARVRSQVPPGHSATEADYEAATNAITQRRLTDPAATAALASAVNRSTTVRQTSNIVAAAQSQPDPKRALQQINTAYGAASPAVQQALLADPRVNAVVDAATKTALEPLNQNPLDQISPQAPGYQAAQRLDDLTAGLNPELAGRVMAAATPRIESAIAKYRDEFGVTPFGQQGVTHLVTALGRGAGTAMGDAAIERIAQQGVWDSSGVITAIAQGANPAYAIAMAKQPGVDPAVVTDATIAGMRMFRDKIAADTAEYGKHVEELAWLVKSHGGAMTPEQLDKAIADYTTEKGPEWKAKAEALKTRLADDGAKLLAQLQTMQHLPPALAGQQGDVDRVLADTLNDPKAHLAISTALQTNPQLTTGAQGQSLLGLFTSTGIASNAKLTDQARKLATEVATAYVKSNVLSRIGDFDPSNPASVQRATQAIESLRDSRFGRALGVSDEALDKAITALRGAVPVAGETAEQAAERLNKLDKALGDFKGFDKSTLPGQLLRGVGLALAGVGLLASIERAGLDPTLKNNLRVLVDGAGLGQKGLELLTGLGKVDEASLAGKLGSGAASKFLSTLTAAIDVWSSAEAFGKGDVPSGILYGAGAGGGLLAAFGTGSIAGPIGIGLVVVSVVGLAIWNGVKEANKHEFDSDGGTSMRFLQHAGFDAEAARTLVDQSGEGYSTVPLLARYAELKGLNLGDPVQRQKFVDWVNAMPPERLGGLRDNLHRTLDDVDGDVGRIGATAADDAMAVSDIGNRPYFAATGYAQPKSAAQIDAVLSVLEIPVLRL